MSPVILARVQKIPNRQLISHLPIHGPKFQTVPHNKIVKEGDDVQFECSVASNGAKTTWDKDRRILSNKTNPRIYTKELDDLRIFAIQNVKQEDAGVYHIVLENQNGRIDANVRLDVVARSKGSEMKLCWSSSSSCVSTDGGGRNGRGVSTNGSSVATTVSHSSSTFNNNKTEASARSTMTRPRQVPPTFLQHLQDTQCKDGDKVELITRIKGATEVVWAKNDLLIPNSPYFEYVHDQPEEVYKLVIHDVFPQDSGVYICEAYNPAGGSISFANLTVNDTQGGSRALAKVKMESAKEAVECIISEIERLEVSEKCNKDIALSFPDSDANSNVINCATTESQCHEVAEVSAADLHNSKVHGEFVLENGISKTEVVESLAMSSKIQPVEVETPIAIPESTERNCDNEIPTELPVTDLDSNESLELSCPPEAILTELTTIPSDNSKAEIIATLTAGDLVTEKLSSLKLETENTEFVAAKGTENTESVTVIETENTESDAVIGTEDTESVTVIETENTESDAVIGTEKTESVAVIGTESTESVADPVPSKSNTAETEISNIPDISKSQVQTLDDEVKVEVKSLTLSTNVEPQVTPEDCKEPESPTFRSDDNITGRSPSVMGPSYLIAMKEETVHIRIKYSGVPQPSVQWTRNGKECEEVVENTELSSVRIERVSYDDSGRYVAKVSNDHGIILHHCFLSVEGPPEPPSSPPLAAYNEVSSSISISWSGSPYDGGSMLTAYIIQSSIDEQEWSDLWTGTRLTYSVTAPNPGSSYRFRIQCQNMYGPGTPSPVSPPVYVPGIHEMTTNDVEEVNLLETLDVQIRPGSLQDYYTKGEELGKGRFGVVFTVTKKETNELFAGKIIRCIKAADKVKVRQEVEIMNILRHPKLLQIMDALENEREICIMTEKVNGGELFERVVADDFTLTEFDCVGFMRQICDGVRFMHQKNIIHLDLKPENILCLTRSTYNIKIIDFGLSQKYDSSTPLRVLFGTPEFISPEIINYETISPASDMWALGVITYVLISGLSPFMGDSDSETFSNITQGLFDFDDEAFDHISEDAKDFISKLLIRRKERRMTPVECLSHQWLAYPEPKKNIVIPTDKLKRFIIRRKWQKTGNAIRALGRMTNLYSSRRSSEAAASANRKSNDSGIFETTKTKESLSVEEESEAQVEEESQVQVERKRQLIRQNRVDSDSI